MPIAGIVSCAVRQHTKKMNIRMDRLRDNTRMFTLFKVV
jgi:hypothetical protein